MSFLDKIKAKVAADTAEQERIAKEAAALLRELDPVPTVPMLPPPNPVENHGAENGQPSDRQQRTEENDDDSEGSDTDDEVIQYQGVPVPANLVPVYRTEVQNPTKPSAGRPPVRPSPLRLHWDTIQVAREIIEAAMSDESGPGRPDWEPESEWIQRARDWLEYTS